MFEAVISTLQTKHESTLASFLSIATKKIGEYALDTEGGRIGRQGSTTIPIRQFFVASVIPVRL
jgi:hypothetical protein